MFGILVVARFSRIKLEKIHLTSLQNAAEQLHYPEMYTQYCSNFQGFQSNNIHFLLFLVI